MSVDDILRGLRNKQQRRVSRPDAFALSNTGLSPFLCAEIGIETNGSSLTLLSVLARLGKDPWAEAARWARLPTAALVQTLVETIGRMPLCAEGLVDAPKTALRLVGLLPDRSRTGEPAPSAAPATAAEGLGRLPLLLVAIVLAMGIAVSLLAPSQGGDRPSAAAPAEINPAQSPAAGPALPDVTVPRSG